MTDSATFDWDGTPVPLRAGDSLAAALAAAGTGALGHSHTGRRRSHFCGMGVCQDCLVVVDGVRGQRACLTEARPGLQVQPQDDLSGTVIPKAFPDPLHHTCDLAIVGAGPAGLTAALVAARAGASVLLLDERSETGGQYFKPRSTGFRGGFAPDPQHLRGVALRQQAEASGATFLTGQTVWFARRGGEQGFDLRSTGAAGQHHVTARTLILATGAMERPAVVPGWTLPGSMTIGAGQTLARRYGISPGRRVLIAGHGPLGLQLAVELRRLGAEVVAVAERSRPRLSIPLLRAASAAPGLVRDGLGYRLRLLRDQVPVLHGWELEAVLGEDRTTGARLRRLSDGATRAYDADTVCAGDGFAPQSDLARLLGVSLRLDPATGLALPQRGENGGTEVPGLWIAGDAGGLGGAQLALAQGNLAARAALETLGHIAPPTDAPERAASARTFQTALWQLYAAPVRATPPDSTPVCRCESITAGTIRAAIASGATDPGALKRATRAGMGRCQGRTCTATLIRLLAEAGHPPDAATLFAPQVPARPVPVAALAREKPEWSGHRESSPAARPGLAPTTPLHRTSADLIVIGAGVTGLSAALFAARDGASVICLDRGRLNGEASGGNAGSLHLQLLSWDFGGKAVSGGGPQLATLPLQQESIALWGDLERDLGADFETRITGGLMVAENPAQIQFLEAKAQAEARVGIHTEVIGPDRIRQIAPHLSDRIVAAAWCPGEGKINPLAGSIALARAAREAGALIAEQTPVTAIDHARDGYTLHTPRGPLTAPRILIAAGGWSAAIARMLGTDLPIKGAPLQMVVTDPAPPLVPCLIAHADRHLTMKQTDAGTLLIGGAWTAVTGPAGQPLVLPDSLEGNLWVAAHTLPAIAGLSVVRSWAAMNIDIDGAPLLCPLPGHPNVTVAATANGYTLGPLMGREAARLALTGRARQDLAPFSLDRFN